MAVTRSTGMTNLQTTAAGSLQTVKPLEVGTTVEIGTLRVHRWADHLTLWDITNAGKRGKKVPCVTVSPHYLVRRSEEQGLLDRVSQMLSSYESFDRAVATLKDLNRDTECLTFSYREERGVDVKPANLPKIEIRTAVLSLTADYRDFHVEDLTDKNNEPTAIPAVEGGVKSAEKFYRWVSANRSTVETFTYSEVLNSMRQLGIRYHDYCAVD